MQELWKKVTESLQSKLSTPGYKTFVSSTRIASYEDGVLTLTVPTDFVMNWVKERCEPALQEIFLSLFNETIVLNYELNAAFSFDDDGDAPPETEEQAPSRPNNPRATTASNNAAINSAKIKLLSFNKKYTFDTFVVGTNTRFAHAAAMAVAEKPAEAYNPLFIYGHSGLGKTHLLHSIGQRAIELKPSLRVVCVNAEDFVNEMIESLQRGQNYINLFRSKFRTVDVLMIDDIQFLMGKERSQEEFFHAFNALYNAQKQIILTSDRPPRELHNLEDRLITRFSWGLLTDVQPPELETRIAILRKKVASESLDIAEDVLGYIAKQIPSNVRNLEGAITRIVAHSSLTGTELSVDFAAETLKNLFAVKQDKHVTISVIKQVVAEYYKLDIEELSAKIRTKEIALARQVAMYLGKDMTPLSLSKIGANFGGRDHTTVLHACDKIKESIKNDHSLLDIITRLKKDILAH